MLLAIDSSSGTSAAVLRDGELLSRVVEPDAFGHAENVGLVVQRALAEAEVAATAITVVALGRGPAPYTGLRVGMAAAVAFAAPRRLPLLGVIALDAVAQHLSDQGAVASGAEFFVASDAKRREFFVARYRAARPMVEVVELASVHSQAPADAYHLPCDAGMIAKYSWLAQQHGRDLADTTALYLRSPDVMPSAGKRVSG